VNVFDLDRALVSDYSRFARSFTQIRAPDIRSQVEQIYATNRFWPEPLISINPHFEQRASVKFRRFGEYRTARLVLAAWDRMERGELAA
jgi:hypothetical protein